MSASEGPLAQVPDDAPYRLYRLLPVGPHRIMKLDKLRQNGTQLCNAPLSEPL